ncbi:MAG: HupE/UreJ family protein [Acidobacteria bacterium]|nr:HupE/UreJ family protein [Acidobacteriota bacterium]
MRFLLTLVLAVLAPAHEIGTTRVLVNFDSARTYEVEIATDATNLAEKLEQIAGGELAEGLDAARLEPLIAAREQEFRRRVKIQFDGVAVQPAIGLKLTPPVDANSAILATIRLTGAIPAGASNFTWSYGWTFVQYALSVRTGPGETPATVWLEGGRTSEPISVLSTMPMDRWSIAWRYLVLGFTHIIPHGLDHTLFVLGIYLLSSRLRSVLWQVSAFTAAHSITLGLSMYGLINVPASIVEPVIALSIAYVAVENIFLSELKSWRVGLVFVFGLLHGMGFAGVLQELGLPRSEFVTALLTFNLGVEAGQLTVIGLAFLLVGWRWSQRSWYRARIAVPASLLIAVTAFYWTYERLFL